MPTRNILHEIYSFSLRGPCIVRVIDVLAATFNTSNLCSWGVSASDEVIRCDFACTAVTVQRFSHHFSVPVHHYIASDV